MSVYSGRNTLEGALDYARELLQDGCDAVTITPRPTVAPDGSPVSYYAIKGTRPGPFFCDDTEAVSGGAA